jgi:trehalose-6-phosphate synthase
MLRRKTLVLYHRGYNPENKSPNGILPAVCKLVETVNRERQGSCYWLSAKPKCSQKDSSLLEFDTNPDHSSNVLVSVNPDDYSAFYYQYSKNVIWPCLHGLSHFQIKNEETSSLLKRFKKVSNVLANAALHLVEEGGIVFLEDYQCWYMPSILRERDTKLNLHLFFHTSFVADTLDRIPDSLKIIENFLLCDTLSFQTQSDLEAFISCIQSYSTHLTGLDIEIYSKRIYVSGIKEEHSRVIDLLIHPVGIQTEVIQKTLDEPQAEVLPIKSNSKKLLCIGRMDYTKGFKETLKVYKHLLLNEGLDLQLELVAVKPNSKITAYDFYQEEVFELVTEIEEIIRKHKIGKLIYRSKPLFFEAVVAKVLKSDMIVVPSVKDGLNLFALEAAYIALHKFNQGILHNSLILGKGTGASDYLEPFFTCFDAQNVECFTQAVQNGFEKKAHMSKKRLINLNRALNKLSLHNWIQHRLSLATKKPKNWDFETYGNN